MRNFIIADNQELTSFALLNLLKADKRNTVQRASDKAGLAQLLKEHEDSVVILDYTLFDYADESQLLITAERFSMAAWVLLSDDLTEKFLRHVMYSSHVFSVVFKYETIVSIRDAIQAASDGNRYISQRAMNAILSNRNETDISNVLTFTEMEILKAIATGKTTKEIANERFSSAHTVNTHRKNIFRKLQVNTAHEAIKYALNAGWVDHL